MAGVAPALGRRGNGCGTVRAAGVARTLGRRGKGCRSRPLGKRGKGCRSRPLGRHVNGCRIRPLSRARAQRGVKENRRGPINQGGGNNRNPYHTVAWLGEDMYRDMKETRKV